MEGKEVIRGQQKEIGEMKEKWKKCGEKKEVYVCRKCKNRYYVSEKALQAHCVRRHPNEFGQNHKTVANDYEIKNKFEKEIGKIHELLKTFDEKIGEMSKQQEDLARKTTKEALEKQAKDLEYQIRVLEEQKNKSMIVQEPKKQKLSYTMESLTCNIQRINPVTQKLQEEQIANPTNLQPVHREEPKKVATAAITDITKVNEEVQAEDSEASSLDFSIETPEKEILKEAIIEDVVYVDIE
eukprot:TRINITY_DN8133_c0_g1_i3.p1 TRINITY_DN8133_c0_g1~~TRINITY_DN8133_c0_g1_i3.p1  ORF type:complete len:240 (-),score=88.84 TRINITY_DN8133_c0_g1_i3:314-1033(-)